MSTAAQVIDPQLASDRKATQTHSVVNATLWTAQLLWGVFFSFTGFGKVLCFSQAVWSHTLRQPVAWFHAVPQGLFVFIGVCEFLGGVGLVLPAITGVKPKLVALAATGLTLVMILAAGFHIARGEYSFFVPMNVALGGVTAFIAYGRLLVRPIAPRPIGSFRVLSGLAVLGALIFAGGFPIWYQLTHTH